MKSKDRWINFSLLIAGTMVGLAIGELAARVFLDPPPGHVLYSKERNEAHASLLNTVSDPRLLHRMSPHAPGHDTRGFRNAERLETADVVAIGDSQTWGINVRREESWPSVLGMTGNMKVYSMSLGGWGPLEYEMLANDALALHPKALLVGIYLGNDIFDSCNHTYGTNASPKYRRDNGGFAAALSDLHARLKIMNDQTRVDRVRQQLAELGRVARLWQRLAGRSLIVETLMARGLLPEVPSVDELYKMADRAWADAHPEAASVYSSGHLSTVLTYGYRGVAVDLENACIRDGVRITREVLGALKKLGETAGTGVGVLLIPTKEMVYVTADGALRAHAATGLADLVKHETAIKGELIDHCKQIGMVCVDAANRLVAAAQQGAVLYKADSDGHPVAEGYRQLAYAGRDALALLGVISRP